MKNLRISAKLLSAFGALGVVLLGLVVFAAWQMSDMNAKASDIAFNRMAKVGIADDLSEALAKFRSAEGAQILAINAPTIAIQAARKDTNRAVIAARMDKLALILTNPRAKGLLGQVQSLWPTYLASDAELARLPRETGNGEASSLLSGPMLKTFDAMMKAADALSDLQAQMGREAAEENAAAYEHARLLMMVATIAALGGAAAILMLLIRQIARPLSTMTKAMGELAAGNMNAVVPDDDRRDEVGDLAKAMAAFRDQLAAAERAKVEQTTLIVDSIGRGLSGLADGDLVSRVDADLTGPFAKLKTDFNAAATALQDTMAQVATAAAGINGGASEVRTASDDLSQRTEQQAASLEETAAAMDEITNTVRSTAERAGSANSAVRSARDEAELSGDVVRGAIAAMGGIERTSNEISEIISVIDGIAFQTNLLALNAGVEAARAGDAGKGFAVVASEVRALAQRSADAAKDVKTRITASGEQVKAGVRLVGETGDALTRIIQRIGEIDGLVSEISEAAVQQSTGLQQVNTAVSEMDEVTQQNAAMVEEATAAARSLAAEAEGLIRQIARFRTGDQQAALTPVHALQTRAAAAVRTMAKAAPRSVGNAALAMSDDWSKF